MLLEHLLYSAAIAILVGMVFYKYTGKDPSWIVIIMSAVPDTDYVISKIMFGVGLKYPYVYNHGDFHNLVGLAVLCLMGAWLFSHFGIKLWHGVICSVIGYCLHFIEDFIVYPPAYAYFYPFSMQTYGINFIPETADLIVMGSEVLIIGLLLFCITSCIKMIYTEGRWLPTDYFRHWLHTGYRMKSHAVMLISNIKSQD